MTTGDRPRSRTDHYRPDDLVELEATAEVNPSRRPDSESLAIAIEDLAEVVEVVLRDPLRLPDDPLILQPGVPETLARATAEARLKAARSLERPDRRPVAYGKPDELNREHHGDWKWVWVGELEGVDPDGSPRYAEHWAKFDGHLVQVDVEFSTYNERTVSEWKGKDSVRGFGSWTISLNRRPVLEGSCGTDVLGTLRTIERKLHDLLEHPKLSPWTQRQFDELEGMLIYYHDQPAVVRRAHLPQLVIAGDPDPIRTAWDIDESDPGDGDSVTDVLDPHIFWWRDKGKTEKPASPAEEKTA